MKKCKCGRSIQAQYRLCYNCFMGKIPKIDYVSLYYQPPTKEYIIFRNTLDALLSTIKYARKN